MAYRSTDDRRKASRRHYLANKTKYLERNSKYRAEINRLVQQIKSKTPCTDCGETYPYFVMDFDHLDGDKKSNIISFLASTGRIGALRAEMAKCELVCSNCHRIRTHNRLELKRSFKHP